ncbi:odorant receptor 10-like [Colletes latitarsis]|uniref:odorant receptor 10-like n=1 Tax=Colletes latitarsis TaxID=2605962 RepID=UPI004035962C
MIVEHTDDISIRLTSIFMKLSGIWIATDNIEQRCRNITVAYNVGGMLFMAWIVGEDTYYVRQEDFGVFVYNMCNVLSLGMAMFKILVLFTHRKDLFYLIAYLKQKFLQSDYDEYEKTIVDTCKRASAFFVCTFTCFAHATLISYVMYPIAVNFGKNDSDRILPFTIRGNLPITMTPYFEILFLIQVLFLYQIGVCYFCFDNFLCIMNFHAAAQFRIVQYRLENMKCANNDEKNSDKWNKSPCQYGEQYYAILRANIKQHQALIAYCDKLEKVFSSFALGQVLVFSLIICLDGYQVLMADAPLIRRIIFVFHTIGCTAQLLMFTYSCDCLIQDSTNVASAAYSAPWSDLQMNQYGSMLRGDLIFVVMRSRLPCCLTARGFFVVSLETYTSVMSTAVSYFTLLKQRTTVES